MLHRLNHLRHEDSELHEKILAILDNYEIARRYVLGLYGWEGVEDIHHIWHYSHPEHVEDEILDYADLITIESEGFFDKGILRAIKVLDRLHPQEICSDSQTKLVRDLYEGEDAIKTTRIFDWQNGSELTDFHGVKMVRNKRLVPSQPKRSHKKKVR